MLQLVTWINIHMLIVYLYVSLFWYAICKTQMPMNQKNEICCLCSCLSKHKLLSHRCKPNSGNFKQEFLSKIRLTSFLFRDNTYYMITVSLLCQRQCQPVGTTQMGEAIQHRCSYIQVHSPVFSQVEQTGKVEAGGLEKRSSASNASVNRNLSCSTFMADVFMISKLSYCFCLWNLQGCLCGTF